MLTTLYQAATATPWAVAGTTALTATALATLAALATLLYEDLQPKGRHHRV